MTITRPLQGVRVLEIASIVFGPLACQYLGDMGAEVIKLEPPEQQPQQAQHRGRP
jgi:crotonobetainyl-CoA:carnitine CoA-transferase CaiB-like acyl-CoA transferase